MSLSAHRAEAAADASGNGDPIALLDVLDGRPRFFHHAEWLAAEHMTFQATLRPS